MPAPFGFSVSDFISTIKLIRDITKALEDSAGSCAEYLDLIRELYSLERALREVKGLQLDESQQPQRIALVQAAGQCQQTIDEFVQKIRKFQPALRIGGSGSGWRDALCKVHWALCKKEDVRSFRARLSGHTASINILMMTIQLQTSTINKRKLEHQNNAAIIQHEDLTTANRGISTNREILDSHTDLISSLTGVASRAATQEQNQELRNIVVEILKTSLRIYHEVLSLQAQLPRQIERQQPVLFLDAGNRLWPIHLEFITSAKAFLAVLKVHFQDIGQRKIERGQFALQEARTKRAIDLRQPWHICFQPDRKIDMSMLFSQPYTSKATCPRCDYESADEPLGYVECPGCGMYYRRILEKEETVALPVPSKEYRHDTDTSSSSPQSHKRKRSDSNEYIDEIDIVEHKPEDDIHLFRRVHIKSRRLTPKQNQSAQRLDLDEKGSESRKPGGLLRHIKSLIAGSGDGFYRKDPSTLKLSQRQYIKTKYRPLCSTCGENFSSTSDLVRHEQEHRPQIYTCCACSQCFGSPVSANRHRETHDNDRFECSNCNFKCTGLSPWERHKRRHGIDNVRQRLFGKQRDQ